MRFTTDALTFAAVALLAAVPQAAAAPAATATTTAATATTTAATTSATASSNVLSTLVSGITSFFGNLGGHTNGADYPPNSGGTGGIAADLQVPADHLKYTFNPASAANAIPAAQDSQLREGHRLAHLAIYEGMGGSS